MELTQRLSFKIYMTIANKDRRFIKIYITNPTIGKSKEYVIKSY